jgi:Tfp pilus assembly protein PilO
MQRTLSPREKNLLMLCAGVLLFMGTAIAGNTFLQRRAAALKEVAALRGKKVQNDTWLSDRQFQEKRQAWLEAKMPTTESLGRAQGQLLEDLQNQALDLGITIQQQTLPEAVKTPEYREVSVNVRVRGDQQVMMQWLARMQSPERFQAIKELQIQLDSRAKEKTPQALCNLTLARWFKPEGGF